MICQNDGVVDWTVGVILGFYAGRSVGLCHVRRMNEGLGGLCCGYDGSMDYLRMKGYYGPNATGTSFCKNQTTTPQFTLFNPSSRPFIFLSLFHSHTQLSFQLTFLPSSVYPFFNPFQFLNVRPKVDEILPSFLLGKFFLFKRRFQIINSITFYFFLRHKLYDLNVIIFHNYTIFIIINTNILQFHNLLLYYIKIDV